jgi:hypothetical protein
VLDYKNIQRSIPGRVILHQEVYSAPKKTAKPETTHKLITKLKILVTLSSSYFTSKTSYHLAKKKYVEIMGRLWKTCGNT